MPGPPLQTTTLVHETFLRLVDQAQARFNDRGHFFATWARAWLGQELGIRGAPDPPA